MEKPFVVPATSAAEVEKFWADGKDAIQPSTGADQPETISHFFCSACGDRLGKWVRGWRVTLGTEIALEPNERVATSLADGRLYVFAHQCTSAVGIDLPGVGVRPLDQASPGFASGRESAGDGVEVVRPPDPVASVEPVHEITLRDRFAASIAQVSKAPILEVSKAADDRIDIAITPLGVAMLGELAEQPGREFLLRTSLKVAEEFAPDYRAIAKELLAALYGMIGHFGMPIKSKELAAEVETALLHAEAAKVDEVLQ